MPALNVCCRSLAIGSWINKLTNNTIGIKITGIQNMGPPNHHITIINKTTKGTSTNAAMDADAMKLRKASKPWTVVLDISARMVPNWPLQLLEYFRMQWPPVPSRFEFPKSSNWWLHKSRQPTKQSRFEVCYVVSALTGISSEIPSPGLRGRGRAKYRLFRVLSLGSPIRNRCGFERRPR